MSRIASMLLVACAAASSFATASASDAGVRDLAREASNRRLVVDFYDTFFNQHQVHKAAAVVAEDYVQHNPDVPDGKAPFVDYFAGFFAENPGSRARIMRSATDGDLVYLHVHSTNGAEDRGQAVIDIFRVENGRLVEHWDVIQDVLEDAANDNSMF